MGKYIAKMPVTVWVDGEKRVINPGEDMPEIPTHDLKELLRLGAIEEEGAEAKAKAKEKAEAEKAGQEYQDARKAVQAAKASIQVPEQPDSEGGGEEPSTPAKAKRTAKK